jgi:glycosyltransferase involved in cell wall biosynthesis
MTEPLISVTMPARNAAAFINESIASVINQTFTNFELVILNDASTDNTEEIIREWQQRDSRIHLLRSERQLGLTGSSNRVVAETRAPLVARMDADDVAHPRRLERQLEVLQKNPDVVAVGTLSEGINGAGRVVRPRDRWRIVRVSRYLPFPHGSIMFRRAAFDAIGGYSEEFTCGEDQDFAYRLCRLGRIVTLPEALYHYRYHDGNATLLTGAQAVRAVRNGNNHNGHDLAALYMMGAMRLWAGEEPRVLTELMKKKHLGWNMRSVVALASASLAEGRTNGDTVSHRRHGLARARLAA